MLEFLEKSFPDRCPDYGMGRDSFVAYSAKVSLIRFIRFKLEEAQESIPEVLTINRE
jgi:hypothetical protein